jgi:hypothetical protein
MFRTLCWIIWSPSCWAKEMSQSSSCICLSIFRWAFSVWRRATSTDGCYSSYFWSCDWDSERKRLYHPILTLASINKLYILFYKFKVLLIFQFWTFINNIRNINLCHLFNPLNLLSQYNKMIAMFPSKANFRIIIKTEQVSMIKTLILLMKKKTLSMQR